MKISFRVLTLEQRDLILDFERTKLKKLELSEIELSMLEWNSGWRVESLEHYLKTGWCFGVWASRDQNPEVEEKFSGYFLAQPLLFVKGQTQSLWIEHISSDDHELHEQLVQLAIRYGKDKHLQKVIFSDSSYWREGLPKQEFSGVWEVKTTK